MPLRLETGARNRVLTDEQAQEILDSSEPAKVFIEKYRISEMTVYNIRNRKRYRHLKPSASKPLQSSSDTSANGLTTGE